MNKSFPPAGKQPFAYVKPSSQRSDNSTNGDLKLQNGIQNLHTNNDNDINGCAPQEYGSLRINEGVEIDDLTNEAFTKLEKELNKESRWEHVGNTMKLTRKTMRNFEQSRNPAKKFLDGNRNMTMAELQKFLIQSNMGNFLQNIGIHLIPETQGSELGSIDNNIFTHLSDKLNRDKNWEKLANELHLKRRLVQQLETEDDPARTLLEKICMMSIRQFVDHLQAANLLGIWNSITSNGSFPVGKNWCDIISPQCRSMNTSRYAECADTATVNAEPSIEVHNMPLLISTGTLESSSSKRSDQLSTGIQNDLNNEENTDGETENDLNRSNNLTELPLELNISESIYSNSTDNFTEAVFSAEHLKTLSKESIYDIICISKLSVNDGMDDLPSTSIDHNVNQNSSDSIEDGTNDSQTELKLTSINLYERYLNPIASPDSSTQSSDKNPEQICAVLRKAAFAQCGSDYRDIQNSLPDMSSNGTTDDHVQRTSQESRSTRHTTNSTIHEGTVINIASNTQRSQQDNLSSNHNFSMSSNRSVFITVRETLTANAYLKTVQTAAEISVTKYREQVFRDIQNSLSYCGSNYFDQHIGPSSAVLLSDIITLSAENQNVDYMNALEQPSSEGDINCIEKTPEQACTELLNAANAVSTGNDFRDIQNSSPDVTSEDEVDSDF